MGALLIAAGTAMGIALMVESFRTAFEDMLDQRLRADLVLSQPEGFADAELAILIQRPGVARVGRYADGEAQVSTASGSGQVALHFVDLDAWEAGRYDEEVVLAPDAVLVNEQAARRFGLSVDEPLRVRNRDETVALRVAAVFSDYGEPRPRLVLSLDWAGKLGPVTVDRVSLVVAPPHLDAVSSSLSGGSREITSQREIRDFAERVFARTFRITDALTALALLVAVAGLYNALSALDVKREDEYRLLSMLGFDGSELRRMSLGQALTLAGLVMVLALPLGAAIAWILCNVLNPRAFGWTIAFRWSALPIVTAVVAGMAAAMVAGLLGRRDKW
jgi:putative ABC transport system permease protein